MKKLLVASLALTCAASVFAQGTITFNNRVTGSVFTRVYNVKPGAGNASVQQIGNGSADTPAGTTDWSAFTTLTGANYLVALLAAPGMGAAESSLVFQGAASSFRTGTAAGQWAAQTITLSNVGLGAPATLEVFAWDNTSGSYSSPSAAFAAWKVGTIAGGTSGTFSLSAVGGDLGTPPNLTGLQSFNIFMIPEPSTMALAGLGAAALLIFRRRK